MPVKQMSTVVNKNW